MSKAIAGFLSVLIYYGRPLLGPRSCRFHLMGYRTCTDYALHVLKTRSVIAACWAIAWRLVRCNPFVVPTSD